MKVCSKCKVDKDESEFNKAKANKDGLCAECRECSKDRQVKYRAENKEKIKEKRKEYKTNNRDIENAAKRRYYGKHKKELVMKQKEWMDNNKEKVKEYQKRAEAKSRADCTNKYVKKVILRSSMNIKNPSKELIEFTRLSIKIKRLIKEKQKCETSAN